jgi:hypothetical protein
MLARLQTVVSKVSALRLRELWLLMSSAGLVVILPILQRVLTLLAWSPSLERKYCRRCSCLWSRSVCCFLSGVSSISASA